MATVEVLDSFMAYTEAGAGGVPVVFLHGNPTSSYLWRRVVPHLAGRVRCLAPDLIGMGASGKPDIGYRFADHARYLDAWFDALGLTEAVVVGHDWGGALALDRAARLPGRVRGLALIETFLRPLRWEEFPARGAALFRAFRSPEGERMILEDNTFIKFNLPHGVMSGLAPEDHDVYRAPYPDPASRRPLLAEEMKGLDAAVFDPPRAGAEAQSREIARSNLSRAVAVSCNPATFARDAKILTEAGFRLDSVTPIDQFLWSAHVELVAVFSR